jgi:sirohydrochlorin cobaltochelatase
VSRATPRDAALLLCSHGATENLDSATPAHRAAAALRARGLFGEVHAVFRKERPSWEEGIALTRASTVYLIPFLLAEGFFSTHVLPATFGLDGAVTVRDGRTLRLCRPVGTHPSLTDVVRRRALDLAARSGRAAQESALLLVGHGTDKHARTGGTLDDQITSLRAATPFRDVLPAFMETEPNISRWHDLTDAPCVLVVPFFLSDGLHCSEDIPLLMGIPPGDPAFDGSPHTVRGRSLSYARAIGLEPGIPDVVLDLIDEHDAAHPAT